MIKALYLFTLLSVLLASLACTQKSEPEPKKGNKAHLVETVTVSRDNLGITRAHTGTLRARREVKIFTQEEGRLTKLPYYEGDQVKKDDIIAKLDDKLLKAQLTRAQATRRKADQDLKRSRDLFAKKLISDEELARAETETEVTKADEEVLATRLSYTTIRAPITGVVSERLSEPGNVVERHSHLLTISDPQSLITEVNVSELILTHLAQGAAAQVRIDALGDKAHSGRIVRIHPNLDPVTRQGTIEVELKPVPKGARPGQLCRVQLDTQISDRIMIPFRALRRDTEGEYVYKIDSENHVARVAVVSGQRVAEGIEILQGLQQGEQIITKGFLDLTPGTKVKVVTAANQSD
ncbi:efflux RND transporter periplasmic adaptor subunit [Kaarinaea lacus]